MYFIYILRCRDDSLYIGHTRDIEKRLEAHNSGVCGVLFAADPPSGGNDEDLPWTNYPCHGWMMNQPVVIG